MNKLHRVPSKNMYIAYVSLLIGVCALFPAALCLDFGPTAYDNTPELFGQCELSYTKRFGQVAPLIAFLGALVALFPSRISDLVRQNKRHGARLVKDLEKLVAQAHAHNDLVKARKLSKQLKYARAQLANSERFRKLERSLVNFGVGIALLATLLSVMETGA